MPSKKRIALLMGGPSAEYEVSMKTGASMLDHLSKDKYQVVPVHITREGAWLFDNTTPQSLEQALDSLQEFDVALLALHGTFGEDGVLQRYLEERNIPFTGSGSHASRLAMSKSASNRKYRTGGLIVPEWEIYEPNDLVPVESIVSQFGLPVVIKPDQEGSSIGVSIVKNSKDIGPALSMAFDHGEVAMVQQFIAGREVSCGILEDAMGTPVALPPTELIPDHAEFFDYEAKYTVGGALEITPPDMPPEDIALIQETALAAHGLLGCAGYSRSDIIYADGIPYIIETNTLPGMTGTSILPQQAAKAGIPFERLLDRLISSAINR